MDIKEIICILNALDNDSCPSVILPWQEEAIKNAKVLDSKKMLSDNDVPLLNCAKTLSPVCKGNIEKFEYFCFMPVLSKRWKVYVLDKDKNVLARLEDFEDGIKSGSDSQNEAFLLKIE